MKLKRNKGYFSISAVAKMFSVHQQTIRLYEKQGLVNPKRSDGNTRLFSEDDIDRLEEIIYLTHELGINLAGVEVIFKLKKQIQKMQKDMNTIFDKTKADLDEQTEQSKHVIKTSASKLMAIRNEALPESEKIEPTALSSEIFEENEDDAESWAIEYED